MALSCNVIFVVVPIQALSILAFILGIVDISVGIGMHELSTLRTGSCAMTQLTVGTSAPQCLLLLRCSAPSPLLVQLPCDGVAGMSAAAMNKTVTFCVAHSPFAESSAQQQQDRKPAAAGQEGDGSTSYDQYDSRECFKVQSRGMAFVVTGIDWLRISMFLNFFIMTVLLASRQAAAAHEHMSRRQPALLRASFASKFDVAHPSYQLGLRMSSCAASCEPQGAAGKRTDVEAAGSPREVVLVLNP